MTLSIVIPAHNCERYVTTCLMSVVRVFSQTSGMPWTSVEVIVVDDGSNDGTGSVIRQFFTENQHCGIIAWKLLSISHGGVVIARQEGVRKAAGDYIWFVDADDEVLAVPVASQWGDLVRFRQEYGWMCVGDVVYSRQIILEAFCMIGRWRLKHGEDGLMQLAALKVARSVYLEDKQIYRYIKREGSSSNVLNSDIVAEKEIYVNVALELGVKSTRGQMSKEACVFIATSLFRWPASYGQIKRVARDLIMSRLAKDGRECIKKDWYARKLMFAMKHPFIVLIYRFLHRA